jgi:polyvinyl alcohol dehydrogenase (cytochrome)
MGGQNLHNTRDQPGETRIGPQNAATLGPKWVFTTGGDVSATPAVGGGAVYIPDWGGNFYKIDAHTGTLLWSHRISDYDGIPSAVARTSPAVSGTVVYIGDQHGAHLMAVDATTGNLIWMTQLDAHPDAMITASPVVSGHAVYVGVSSSEEAAATTPGYVCCTFRGSVVALDAATGHTLWKTYTVPPNNGQAGGYSGAAMWSSTPVVDAARNALYITTGNNYSVPISVSTCLTNGGTSCYSPDDHFDSVMALNLTTGAVKWAKAVQPSDTENFACVVGPSSNCPPPAGPDFDFGAGPNLYTVTVGGQPHTILGAGQKSGIYWALDPDTGQILWSTQVGPGGRLGGIEWGTATDGQRVYVAISNTSAKPYTLVPSGQTIKAGSWSALDAATGQILWQTADPLGAFDPGPVTVANGVAYAGSMDKLGHVYALDAATGTILWSFATGGGVNGGPAVVDGVVYWGSGYSKWSEYGVGSGNHQLYAFTTGTARLIAAPTSGSVQQTVALTGTAFTPGEQVALYWDGINTPPLTAITATANGSLAAQITVPQAVSGTHTIVAQGQTSKALGFAAFQVKPRTIVQPAAGVAGAAESITGYGFGATEAITSYWLPGGRPVGGTTTNSAGTFSGSAGIAFTVPVSPAATYTIVTVGQASRAVTTNTFKMLPSSSLTLHRGAAGPSGTVDGLGYGRGEIGRPSPAHRPQHRQGSHREEVAGRADTNWAVYRSYR